MRFIDVSSNNHPAGAPIDWQAVADDGIQGAVIKVAESDYTNPDAQADYAGAEASGMACLGLYDFARQDLESGASDATLFLAGIGSLGGIRPGTRPALDVEEHGGAGPQVDSHADLAAYALDWAGVVTRALGIRPFLYSRRQYLIDHKLTGLGGSLLDPVFDLWLVWDGDPNPPPGWSRVAMWQHLDDAMSVPGIVGPVDHDDFLGIAYDWLSKSWGYQQMPTTSDTPDVDPNLDTPSILRHLSDTLRSLHADTAILIARGGLIG